MNYLELINVQIRECKFKDSLLKNVTDNLQRISFLYGKFAELNLKNEIVDTQLREIQQLVQKLIDHNEKRRFRFFLDSEKSRLTNDIPYKIGLLKMNLETKEKQLDVLTTSDLRRQSIIQAGSIQIEALIIFTHTSIDQPLEKTWKFEFQEEADQNQVFSLYVKRKTLFDKLIMQVDKFDDQNWLQYFDSYLDKRDKLFFYIYRDRKEKTNKLFSPLKSFTLKNSYKIYLCSGMQITCGQAREIKIAACSTPKYDKVHEQFQSNCLQNSQAKGSINVSGYNYIKLHYLTLNCEYEFYLKNQSVDLEDYLPGIRAKLWNDEKGFYLTCKENELIRLNPFNELITNSSDLPFCIQISKECSMEIKFNKQHAFIFE